MKGRIYLSFIPAVMADSMGVAFERTLSYSHLPKVGDEFEIVPEFHLPILKIQWSSNDFYPLIIMRAKVNAATFQILKGHLIKQGWEESK